jgi:hypothetical protein
MSIVLVGSTSGSITLQEPAVAGTTVLTLPAVTGTVLTDTSPKAGNVIQVVSTAKTDTFSESVISGGTSGDVTGLTASITPSATSSKILVNFTVSVAVSGAVQGAFVKLYRDGSLLSSANGNTAGNRTRTSASVNIETNSIVVTACFTFLDSPSSTSSLTYSVRLGHSSGGTRTVYVNRSEADSDTSDFPRAASTITVMEIAA